MDHALANLIAGCTAFVGSHFVLSHPFRAPLVRLAGEKGFAAIYSLVAFATFGWLFVAFRAAPVGEPVWNGTAELPWFIATLLMLVASVLLIGSFQGNPALRAPGAAALAEQAPHGVFNITRHPMMWSFALWSVSHVMVSPTPRVIVLALAMAVLALIGAHLQDRKKEGQMGQAWTHWEGRTSYWPKLGGLAKAGAVPWIGGLVLWLVATWAHAWLAQTVAGVWRWVG